MAIVKIGLTGGIASGKSTIAKMFKDLGAEIIDADLIAHQAIKKETSAYKKIVRTFGPECLNKKGEINRSFLGKIVFENPEKRRILNAIVHPEVFQKEKDEEKKIRKNNRDAVIIYDMPLLIETRSHLKMDKVVLVWVKRAVQLKRLISRNRLTQKEGLRRIRAQMPFYQKKKIADYLINGDEEIDKIRKKVKKIFEEVTRTTSLNR